jgi:uncharacterized protein involved in exopolysaccharide biosynthesis
MTISQRAKMIDIQETLESGISRRPALRLFFMLFQRRYLIIAFTGAGLLLGISLALLLPPQFESTTTLMPPENSSGTSLSTLLASRSSELPGVASSMLRIRTSGALFVGVLQSRSAQDDLILQFNLEKQYSSPTIEQTRKVLASRSAFSEDGKSGIITIRVRDRDKHRAQEMCQEYVAVLNKLITQDAASAARSEREFLEKRLAAAKSDLSEAESTFSRFAAKNKAIDIPEQTHAMVGAAATLQGQLTGAEAELSALKQIYASQNVRVLAAEGRVETLRGKLQQLAGTAGQVDGGDQLLSPSLEQLPSVGVGYEDLYRNLKLQEGLFTELSTQYELARVEEAKETPAVRVLDPPSLPEKRISPSRVLLVVGLTIFMFSVGCTWASLSSLWGALSPVDPRKQFVQFTASELRGDLLRNWHGSRSGRDSG